MIHPIPAPENLQQIISYDPNSGELTYLRRPREHFKSDRVWKIWNSKCANMAAFSVRNSIGYLVGTIDSKRYLAHRIAWTLARGPIPDGHEIDHINGNRSDNRLSNLRCVPLGENHKNKSLQRNNTSGVPGVSWFTRERRWVARIKSNRKVRLLGYFKNFDDAVAARKSAEKEMGFHPNHGRPLKYV